jgi:predicted flap endonuclease-1-like 5' DNA nuclease
MTIVLGVVLIVLGWTVGFIIAWAFNVGATLSLFIGLLLVVAGAIIGFISEWLIDEAYRKNRELRRQLSQPQLSQRQLGERGGATMAPQAISGGQGGDFAAEALADLIGKRDEEVRELRQQLSAADSRLDDQRDSFEAYQRTHPDDLTVIKGIGPVYQWKLRDAGFNTYQQLAASDPEQLRRMLDIKNWQRVNVDAWVGQACDWAHRD